MYGTSTRGDESFANGVIIAYWIKMALASYAIAYYQFGFRLPDLPFDVTSLIHTL